MVAKVKGIRFVRSSSKYSSEGQLFCSSEPTTDE
jgi:hypothetical protein